MSLFSPINLIFNGIYIQYLTKDTMHFNFCIYSCMTNYKAVMNPAKRNVML